MEGGKPVKIRLQIWDTAGGEQYRSLTPIYYKNAKAICLCYDSTDAKSFEALQFWVG
jgi:GTPase SAR1 family protein